MNTDSEFKVTKILLSGAQCLRSRFRIVQKQSELLASRLKDKKLLGMNVMVAFYPKREENLLKFFENQCNFVFCCDIPRIVSTMRATCCDSTEWRLFIDSSKRSLKYVLLHIGNIFGAIPIGHSVHLKEIYEHIKQYLIF